MEYQNRASAGATEIAVVFVGNSFAIKDTLKEHGFRFDRNEIDWCGLPETTGQAIWWKVIQLADAKVELAFTKNLASVSGLTMITTDAAPFK